jgi:hypothetical protein
MANNLLKLTSVAARQKQQKPHWLLLKSGILLKTFERRLSFELRMNKYSWLSKASINRTITYGSFRQRRHIVFQLVQRRNAECGVGHSTVRLAIK